MNLQENIRRIKEVMGLLYEQNEKEKEWLINWFSSVPQEKLNTTFGQLYYDFNTKKFSLQPIVRDKILQIIKGTEIIHIDRSEVPPLMQETWGKAAGVYMPPKTEQTIINDINLIFSPEMMEGFLSKYTNQKKDEAKKYFENLKKQMINFYLKVNGKVMVLMKNIEDTSILSHELTHAVYNMVPNNVSEIISKICSKKCGDMYYTQQTEIYSYLMSFRQEIGLQAGDIISKVNMFTLNVTNRSGTKNYIITLDVNRGKEKIKLPSDGTYNLSNKNPISTVFECCSSSENIAQVIMSLHNELAVNKKSDFDKNV